MFTSGTAYKEIVVEIRPHIKESMVDYNCLLITTRTLSQKRFIYICVEENIELLKEIKISDIEDDVFYVVG